VKFDRGTRVLHEEPGGNRHGQLGIVLHLPGDPADEQSTPSGYHASADERWIRYEDGECEWTAIRLLSDVG